MKSTAITRADDPYYARNPEWQPHYWTKKGKTFQVGWKKLGPEKTYAFYTEYYNQVHRCFVATATLGDYDHPIVMDLRKYRDEVLEQRVFGRLFIRFYYKFGPIPANIIARNKSLRNISLKYLIKPIHKVIKPLLS